MASRRPDLDDWTLVDVKYKNEKQQEIARTIPCVSVKNQWRIGDSGILVKIGRGPTKNNA